jgi:hypothetical protein
MVNLLLLLSKKTVAKNRPDVNILVQIPSTTIKKGIILKITGQKDTKNSYNNSNCKLFLDILDKNGFESVKLRYKKNYLLFQNTSLKMFYIRVYNNRYCIYPLCNSDEWLYKEELFSDVDWNSDNVIYELLKDNKFTEEQLTR